MLFQPWSLAVLQAVLCVGVSTDGVRLVAWHCCWPLVSDYVLFRLLISMATELLQLRDLASVTFFQSSCVILASPTDCHDDCWRDTFFWKHEHGALWLLICGTIEKNTYFLTCFIFWPGIRTGVDFSSFCVRYFCLSAEPSHQVCKPA